MITTELSLVAHYRPEVMERVLRVIRHRGFKVIQLQMKLADDKIWCDMQLQSERAIHLLTEQLRKLYDVIDVSLD